MNENMILNLGGSGGAALNFKVVGNPQPENPRENTIWLNTDVPIGAWYFSATQPENLAEGDVWFPVGTSSPVEFNALKKNGIQVYSLSAKQYVDGALVAVTAKIYQGGAWIDWDVYLFDYGRQHYEWQVRGWKRSSSSHMLKAPTVKTNTDGSVTLSLSATTKDTDRYPGGVYELVEDFDLTGVASLELECDYSNTQASATSADGFCLAVVPRSATYWDSGAVAKVWSKKANATLDVSNVASGSYDVVIGLYLNAENYGAGTMTVTMRELKAVRGIGNENLY